MEDFVNFLEILNDQIFQGPQKERGGKGLNRSTCYICLDAEKMKKSADTERAEV